MPKRTDIKKILVIGSGPIIIGQAAEFDYAGSQACQSLREEGYEVILINSNPATIMTDTAIADRVYIEPVNVEFLESVIKRERPDSLLATLGGQVGLNLAIDLEEKGILREYNVQLLGTQIYSIKRAEDRELFKETMEKINQPIPESAIVETMAAAKEFARKVGFPLIVRPAYTLGGTGGGIAESEDELDEIVNKGLKYSLIGQALIEKLDISVTYLQGIGGYTGQDKDLIYCVISRLELPKMLEIIKEIDPKAFVSVVDVHEVYGGRFRKRIDKI